MLSCANRHQVLPLRFYFSSEQEESLKMRLGGSTVKCGIDCRIFALTGSKIMLWSDAETSILRHRAQEQLDYCLTGQTWPTKQIGLQWTLTYLNSFCANTQIIWTACFNHYVIKNCIILLYATILCHVCYTCIASSNYFVHEAAC